MIKDASCNIIVTTLEKAKNQFVVQEMSHKVQLVSDFWGTNAN